MRVNNCIEQIEERNMCTIYKQFPLSYEIVLWFGAFDMFHLEKQEMANIWPR